MYKVMKHVEPHLLATICASEAAVSVLDLLPAGDLVEDLKNLIYIQYDIFTHILQGKHYGTNNINDFMDYVQEIKSEMRRIKNAQ